MHLHKDIADMADRSLGARVCVCGGGVLFSYAFFARVVILAPRMFYMLLILNKETPKHNAATIQT